jgi:ribosomal protein S18 acetylase RimI-like enzyme
VAGLEIMPFADEHLNEAARLLADRHARHRAAEPLLSPRFEEPELARAELERAWHVDDASGAAAFRNGRMAGYLVGAPRPDPVWGANLWVEAPGHAIDQAEDAEVVRDLYAAAAARWVEAERVRHSVLVPATDEALLDAWWRLSFGKQQAHAVQEVHAPRNVSVPDGFEIRPPRADEIEQLIDVDLALPEHQRGSPVFGGAYSASRDESRAEWVKTLEQGEEHILIGAHGGRPVACWALVPAERSNEHRGLQLPDHACHLGFAATLPEFRGTGIGVALTDAAFAWADAEGYAAMITDWRVTNLLSSRFWPRRGFRVSFLRLYRAIP